MICESCSGRDCTYINDQSILSVNMSYICEQCRLEIYLDYCRGHDLFYECSCPYCDELKDE